jgi:hypothetical protein
MENNELISLDELYERITNVTNDPNPQLLLEFLISEDLFTEEEYADVKIRGYNSDLTNKVLLNLIDTQPNNILFGPKFVYIICGDQGTTSNNSIRKLDQSQKMRHNDADKRQKIGRD